MARVVVTGGSGRLGQFVVRELFTHAHGVSVLDAIKPLRFLGNDLIVFHVLDPQEINFDYKDASSFEDLESREQMSLLPGDGGPKKPDTPK